MQQRRIEEVLKESLAPTSYLKHTNMTHINENILCLPTLWRLFLVYRNVSGEGKQLLEHSLCQEPGYRPTDITTLKVTLRSCLNFNSCVPCHIECFMCFISFPFFPFFWGGAALCGLRDLGSPTQAIAVKALSPKHWTAREIPASFHVIFKITPQGRSHLAQTRAQVLESVLGIHPGLHHVLTEHP